MDGAAGVCPLLLRISGRMKSPHQGGNRALKLGRWWGAIKGGQLGTQVSPTFEKLRLKVGRLKEGDNEEVLPSVGNQQGRLGRAEQGWRGHTEGPTGTVAECEGTGEEPHMQPRFGSDCWVNNDSLIQKRKGKECLVCGKGKKGDIVPWETSRWCLWAATGCRHLGSRDMGW